jgi:hypothetical protein
MDSVSSIVQMGWDGHTIYDRRTNGGKRDGHCGVIAVPPNPRSLSLWRPEQGPGKNDKGVHRGDDGRLCSRPGAALRSRSCGALSSAPAGSG